MTMKSAAASAAGSVVNSSCPAARKSGLEPSPVGSPNRLYFSTLACDRSKPIVLCRLPNSTASGKPTYPSPTTATTLMRCNAWRQCVAALSSRLLIDAPSVRRRLLLHLVGHHRDICTGKSMLLVQAAHEHQAV